MTDSEHAGNLFLTCIVPPSQASKLSVVKCNVQLCVSSLVENKLLPTFCDRSNDGDATKVGVPKKIVIVKKIRIQVTTGTRQHELRQSDLRTETHPFGTRLERIFEFLPVGCRWQ